MSHGNGDRRDGPSDERVSLHPLNPREALKALLKVDPTTVPAEPNGEQAGSPRRDKPTKR